VTPEDIRERLSAAAELRFPKLKGLPVGQKIESLEDYLVDTAIHRGELEEARLHTHEALAVMLDQWDDIEGWERLLSSSSRGTQEEIRRAKKTLRPELHDGINDGKRLVARLSEQISRLEQDDKVASRVYTLVTGA